MANKFSKSRELFNDRISMKNIINPDNNKVFFDMNFAENILYGCIDDDSSVIIPNTEKLIQLKEQQNKTFQVFDFVAAMFAKVKANLRTKQALNRVSRDNPDITKMVIKRAYESPSVKYERYIENLIENFEAQFEDSLINYNITSFDDYVKQFFYFLKNNFSGSPLTLGEWMKSSKNSIFSTGLAISIANIDLNDDREKAKFVATNAFEYFKLICLNEGFYLLENTPWVMVANITSPKTIQLLRDYNYLNNSLIINNKIYYSNIYDLEYKFIRNILINKYNIYATSYPLILKYNVYGLRKTIQQEFLREKYNPDGRYNDGFWIDYFMRLKNIERPIFNDIQLKEIDDYRKKIENLFDKETAMSYINNIFKEKYKDDPYFYRFLYQRFIKEKQFLEESQGITRGTINLGGSSGGY